MCEIRADFNHVRQSKTLTPTSCTHRFPWYRCFCHLSISNLIQYSISYFAVCSSGDRYNPPLPFASLLHLNLANNLIFEEEGLLALVGWPSLRELVIWGNPLTTAFKGDPPILSFQLGRLKGVRIFR